VQIDHVGYLDRTLAERKARRKLRLLRMDYAVDPNNASTLLHLGIALHRMPNKSEARTHLLRLVDMGLDHASYMRWVYQALAEMSLVEGRPAEAAYFAERGLTHFPADEHLLFSQAMACYAAEDYAAVVRILERVIHSPPSRDLMFCAVANVRNKLAPRLLGAVRRMQQAYSEAEATLQAVLGEFPDDTSTWYNLGLVYLDQGAGQKLVPVVRNLLNLRGGKIEAGLLAALWYLRHGDPTLAGPVIDDLIAQAPQMPRPRMLRAEWLSRCGAPLEAQIHALRDVLRIQPGNIEAHGWLKAALSVQAARAQTPAGAWSSSVVLMPGVPVG
jgi:tetratricopeptide (TPR) repeat protein